MATNSNSNLQQPIERLVKTVARLQRRVEELTRMIEAQTAQRTEDRLITASEAAHYLGDSVTTIQQKVRRGELSAVRNPGEGTKLKFSYLYIQDEVRRRFPYNPADAPTGSACY